MVAKKLVFILCLFLNVLYRAAPTQEEVVERLYYTCKVWGYLKYHHSNITAFNSNYPPVDWDDALIASLDGIMSATSHASFHDSLNILVNKAGSFLPFIDYWGFRGDSFSTKDFSWFQDPFISSICKSKLEETKSQFKNQAIGYFYFSPFTPFIRFDKKFYNDSNPNERLRLLALFRYWNLIEYTYQYKPLLNPSWNQTLKQYITEILEAKSHLQYILIMKRLTTAINDSKALFEQPDFNRFIGDAYLPFKFRYIEGKTILINKPDSISNLQIGDELVMIEEQPINMLREYYRTYTIGANAAANERNIDEYLSRGNAGFTYLTFKDDKGQSVYIQANRTKDNWIYNLNIPITRPIYDTNLIDGCTFGIIDYRNIQRRDLNTENLERIWHKDAWIIDLRGSTYTGVEDFLIHYIFNDYKEYYFYRIPNLSIPGEFFSEKVYYDGYTKPPRPRFNGKIILLVDEYTKGRAEYDAMSLLVRENVMVIGSTTDGSGSNKLAHVYLPGNIYTTYTFEGAQNKAKKSYYSTGVPIDSFKRPSISDIRLGKDVLLEAALKCENAKLNISKDNILSFNLFPNPASDRIRIVIPLNLKLEYNIYNTIGKIIKQGKLANEETEIFVENFPRGLYIFQAGNFQSKFIKE